MSDALEALKRLVDECTDEDRIALARYLKPRLPSHPLETEWGINAETILSAILRSSDLTKRGVRGIIAEAIFESEVLPTVEIFGWRPGVIASGNWPYDALLEKGNEKAKIQVKLQRIEAGEPKRFYPKRYTEELFVVEVQKTRTGKRTKKPQGDGIKVAAAKSEETRPYRFGEFDILAVNVRPSTRRWDDFRYTLSDWLLPRAKDPSLIEIFQPVSLEPNDVWTDNLGVCLQWLSKHERRIVLRVTQRIGHEKVKVQRPRKKW